MNLKSKLLGANPNESTPLSRAIFFIVIGVAFYLLDRFSLFIIDDYMYAFKYGTYEPIRTIKDIFESQCDHYMQLNGRFLVHCIVQLFCGILGVEWFRIFNTILFVLFCAMTTRLVSGTYRTSIMWYALTTFAVWLFIPRIGFTILGNIACGVNYLWVGVATIVFVSLWQKICQDSKNRSFITNVGLGIVGFIIGSLQESFSIPVAGALFIYYCLNFHKFRGSVIWLVCGYWLGAVVLIVAPGNFIRLQNETSSENNIIVSVRRFFAVFGSYWLLILAVVSHIIICCRNRVKIQQFISQNILFYEMLLIGLTFTIIIAYTGEHQLFFVGWLTILILLRIIYTYWNSVNVRIQYIVSAIIFLCMVPMYGYTYKYRDQDYNLRKQLVEQIKDSKNGEVIAGEYIVAELNKNRLAKRYTIKIGYEPKMYYTSLYHTGDTKHLSNFIPCSYSEMLNEMCNENLVSYNIWYLPKYKCYIIKWEKGKNRIEAVYAIKGISALKRRLLSEPLNIPYIIKKDQIEDAIEYNKEEYLFYYVALNGPVVSIQLI